MINLNQFERYIILIKADCKITYSKNLIEIIIRREVWTRQCLEDLDYQTIRWLLNLFNNLQIEAFSHFIVPFIPTWILLKFDWITELLNIWSSFIKKYFMFKTKSYRFVKLLFGFATVHRVEGWSSMDYIFFKFLS